MDQDLEKKHENFRKKDEDNQEEILSSVLQLLERWREGREEKVIPEAERIWTHRGFP